MSQPKRSIKITDHFACTSANVNCCVTCTYCKKLYRKLVKQEDDVVTDSENTLAKERNDKDASKPVAIHFNLPNHSKQHMAVVGKDCKLPYAA